MSALEDSPDDEVAPVESLAERVRLSVDRSRMHGLRLIDIDVDGDKVVLSGQVVTFHQKQLATAFARRVVGVAEVVNHLEVKSGRNDDQQERASDVRWQHRAAKPIDRKAT
jgi:osmotically-inducible protein OsmY